MSSLSNILMLLAYHKSDAFRKLSICSFWIYLTACSSAFDILIKLRMLYLTAVFKTRFPGLSVIEISFRNSNMLYELRWPVWGQDEPYRVTHP